MAGIPQSQGFRPISPQPPQPHRYLQHPPTSFTTARRPLPTPKARPESLPPPPRATAQTPAPSRPAPIPAPAPSRPAILAPTVSLETTTNSRRPLPDPRAKSKHASLDLRAQLEKSPTESDLSSAASPQGSVSSFSPFSAASGISSFPSPAPSSSVSSAAQSFTFSNPASSSGYTNTPPSSTYRSPPVHSFSTPVPSSSYSFTGPVSSYPPTLSQIDMRAVPLSPAPPKFTPHWKRGLPEPTPQLNHPSESSSRSGPYMERRSTVSGSAASATNGFPSTSHPPTRSVSPDRMGSSVIDHAQTLIHRAHTQSSSGRRPLPSIGTRSPPAPPLPGSSRSLPVQSSSRSPPVPGNSRPGSSQSPSVPGGSRWLPEPGSSRGPDSSRSPPVKSSRSPPISGSSKSPPVPAGFVSQMTRATSNAPSSSSVVTNFSHLSSATTRSLHARMPAMVDDEASDAGDNEETFDGDRRFQEERRYGDQREEYGRQHGGYNGQNGAHSSNGSPQYGIRDLPCRTPPPSQESRPRTQERQWTRTRPTRSATLPTPPSQTPNDIQDNEPQSLTLRIAALGLPSSSKSPTQMQSDLSRQSSMQPQSSRSSSPSFDLGSHPLLQHVPSTKEYELDGLPTRLSMQRGQSVIEELQDSPVPIERRVSGKSRSLVREQEWRSTSPAHEQSPVRAQREHSPYRQRPQNIPSLPRTPLSPAENSPFAFGVDGNRSFTRSPFTRPSSPVKNPVPSSSSSGFSRPTSPSKSPLPTPPRPEAAGGTVFSSPRKASGGKGSFTSQNQHLPSGSPKKSNNAFASPKLPTLSSPPKLAYLSNSNTRNAFPPSAFPSSFSTSHNDSAKHSARSNTGTSSSSHIMERQRQKQRAYVSTYDLDDEPPTSPLRERVGLPSPSASRSSSPSDLGAHAGEDDVRRGRANRDEDNKNYEDNEERSPSPIRFAKRSSTQFSVLEMGFVGGGDVPRWHWTQSPRGLEGKQDGESRRVDENVPVVSCDDAKRERGHGAVTQTNSTPESSPRITVLSATPPRVAVTGSTPPRVAVSSATPPRVAATGSTPPRIAVSGSSPPHRSSPATPQISVSSPSMPQISVSSPPQLSVSASSSKQPSSRNTSAPSQELKRILPPPPGQNRLKGAGGQNNGFNVQSGGEISGVLSGMRGNGLSCGGCGGPIIGRIVSAMGHRWHPGCFCCSVCNGLLEHVSSYEHEGKPYCHLDYHESFAPRCYHCKTAIVDERFITLDDEALGKRTYHEQHFFCAECGDPFLPPSSGNGGLTVTGDGEFDLDDDVGFTVYKGHPYCEACHVRLRMPKCKRCKKSIRDGMRAVEALGGKWCWECFVCVGCKKPFEDPSFFLRDNKPFCEPCFSLILRNEV